MSCITYAIAIFALVATLFAQNGAPVSQGNSGQPDANTQDSPNPSPTAASATAPPDSTQLEPIQTVQPTYPSAAREQNVAGQVLLMISVSEVGNVEYVNVLRGDPLLRDSAVEAAKGWKFKPFMKAGRPAEAIASLSFEFGSASVATNGGSPADSSLVRGSVSHSGIMPKSVRVSSGVTQGLILSKVAPEYPESAKKARIQGSVVIAATISTEGAVKDLKVVSGPPALVDAAVDAVRQWRYKPYIFMGRPIEVDTQMTINFALNVR